MADQYLINGQWRSAGTAETMLRSAARTLSHSGYHKHQDAKALVQRSWRMVASRPELADAILKMSDELREQFDYISENF